MSKFETLCNEYRENKRLIEELTEMNEQIKAGIIELMDGRESVTDGASKATYKPVTSTRFDSKEFGKAYPALLERYSVTTSYKRFTVV